jgi:hypothetical protein
LALPRDVRQQALERLFPEADPYVRNPVGWMTEKCKRWLWSKQRDIMESVRDNRFTYVPACHGPGKSFTASGLAAWWIDAHPPGEAFVLTTAPSDSQVKSILWREIAIRHDEAGMQDYSRITLDAHWYVRVGGRDQLVGIGRKPQDYKADLFQGIHAKYVLVIVDEACGVPKALFDALETLMTNDYARMLAIGNPDDPASYFEQLCRPGSDGNVIRISAFSTPNFTGEFVPKDVAENLVTPLWVDERKRKWGETSPLYIAKVHALFPEISSDTLITPQMIRIAQEETNIAPMTVGSYGFDVARLGGDETTVYRNRNGKIRLTYRAHMQTTDITADAVTNILRQHGVQWVPMYTDILGLGAGVFDELKARGLSVVPVNVSLPAMNDERFSNQRAEYYWKFREGFEKREIDIDPNDEDLAAQLVSIKWGLTRKKGQIYIESKDEMKRRGLPSPDRADGAMLSYGPAAANFDLGTTVVGETIAGDLLTMNM